MKKVLSLLAIAAMFSFVACNNSEPKEDPAAAEEATNDQNAAEGMEDATNAMEDAAGDAADAVEEAAGDAADAVEEAADAVKEGAEKAMEEMEEAAH